MQLRVTKGLLQEAQKAPKKHQLALEGRGRRILQCKLNQPVGPGLRWVWGALSWLRKGPWVLGSFKVWLGRLLQDTSPGQQGLCTQRLLSRMERALDIVLADRLSSQKANCLQLS